MRIGTAHCLQDKVEVDSLGEETAGINLDISNFAAVSYSTRDYEFPGSALKTEDLVCVS